MEVKNSIGNVEAKELMYMTHGHELKGGGMQGRGGRGKGGTLKNLLLLLEREGKESKRNVRIIN